MFHGKPFPTIDQLIIISKYLDCSLYYLIGIQEESYRELSSDTRKVADAYSLSDDSTKAIIKRILEIK